MFSIPQQPTLAREGSDAEHPLRLDGVSIQDFKNFLRGSLSPTSAAFNCKDMRLLLTNDFRAAFLAPAPKLDTSSWLSVLRLSSMWQMTSLRKIAINQMDELFTSSDASERLIIAEEFDVSEWILTALTQLICRGEPVSMVDAENIGIERALKVAACRERIRYSLVSEGQTARYTAQCMCYQAKDARCISCFTRPVIFKRPQPSVTPEASKILEVLAEFSLHMPGDNPT
jgi:hypothetical protein